MTTTMEPAASALTGTEALCWKCLGTGRLTWTSNANGVCFACKGTGRFVNKGRRSHASTFSGGTEGIVWQFLPVGENGYQVKDAKPGDERVHRVLFQAVAINAANPRASRTALRVIVKPEMGRKAMRLALAGASVDDVARVVGVDETTKPAAWFSRNTRGVDVL